MSNYTGIVRRVLMANKERTHEYTIDFHVGVDDPEQAAKITQAAERDGYAPVSSDRLYMVNGSLVEEKETRWGAIGFKSHSAHLRP